MRVRNLLAMCTHVLGHGFGHGFGLGVGTLVLCVGQSYAQLEVDVAKAFHTPSGAATESNCYEATELVRKASTSGDSLSTREALYRKALAQCSVIPEGHYNLGLILREQGDHSAALDEFKTALGLKDSEVFAVAVGVTLRDLKKFSDAKLEVENALERHPKSVRLLQLLSMTFEDLGDRPRALETLERAKAIDSNDFTTWFNLAVLYERSGQREAARVAYARAAEIEPQHADTQLYLGRVLRELGEKEKSRQAFDRAALLAPNNAQVQLAISSLYDDGGDYARAELALQRALESDPKNIAAWVNLGLVQLDAERPGDALTSAKEALSISSSQSAVAKELSPADKARILGVMGWALLELGRIEEAVVNFEQALALVPENAAALLSLAEARARQGKSQDAEDIRLKARGAGDKVAPQVVRASESSAPWQMWR